MRRQLSKISANPRRIEWIFLLFLSFKRRLKNSTSKCCFPLLEKVQIYPANLLCFFTNPNRIERFPMTSRRPHMCPKTIELRHVKLLTNPVRFDLFYCKRFEFFCSKYICIDGGRVDENAVFVGGSLVGWDVSKIRNGEWEKRKWKMGRKPMYFTQTNFWPAEKFDKTLPSHEKQNFLSVHKKRFS